MTCWDKRLFKVAIIGILLLAGCDSKPPIGVTVTSFNDLLIKGIVVDGGYYNDISHVMFGTDLPEILKKGRRALYAFEYPCEFVSVKIKTNKGNWERIYK